jgi:hypothetical protein
MSDNIQFIDLWMEQALKETLEWHRTVAPKLTDVQVDAFTAGFQQGWNTCVRALKQHKHLKV